jgi:hypothetical protein
MLKDRFPNRELLLQLNAYGLARNPPIGIAPDDNVMISSVANFHLRSPGYRKLPMEQHAGWAKNAKHLMWRPNLGNPAGWAWGLPDVAMTQAAEDFRFVAKHHCIGLYFDMVWGHWATQGPHYYAIAHLAWNPQTDVEALMNEYYRLAFGPAAEELKAYWQLMERTRMDFVSEYPSRYRAFDIHSKYTPELLAEANAHLDRAQSKLSADDEKYHRRLRFVRCGLEFTMLVIDTRAKVQKVGATGGKDAKAKNRALANWRRIAEMKEEFPEFAINWWGVMREPRRDSPASANKRIMGLHPDVPLSDYMRRRIEAEGLE